MKGMKGKHHTIETKRKMSKARLGNKNCLGHHHSIKTKKKIGLANKGKTTNEKNYGWKGNKASYRAIHIWLRKNKPKPKYCEFCNKNKSFDLANIKNHKHSRNPDDYKWACRSCHRKLDIQKIKK